MPLLNTQVMRILFDQGTPVQIGRSLSAHSVRAAREQGWSTLANGELLRVAEEAGFDLLLTTDKNLRYQENLLNAGACVNCTRAVLFVRPKLTTLSRGARKTSEGHVTEATLLAAQSSSRAGSQHLLVYENRDPSTS